MPSMEKRMVSLEKAVETHLIESGEIRTTLKNVEKALDDLKDVPADNKWLKKAVWFIFTSPFLIEAVKHVHLTAGK